MPVLPIVFHPNEVLEKECKRVTIFDKKLRKLLDNMYDTMIEADGVGLAAPQIGLDISVAIVDIGDDSGTIELVNPEILETNGIETDIEGCLSFPNLYGTVTRPAYVKVKAQDRKGKAYTIEAEGFLARAIQHEIDHLHGVLFTSKVERYIEAEELERYEVE
ncbi:peptide deformylase [Bacillus coahuilensis p1.1.43]|uniref:Peptide deformylase n=1 Tax=Bacillus coahuilensis p1.1.43 TaxID=1150625 RepID=A0A147K9L5_9BACI|nr:peptide deformylase [Bacillus coahuilensis]KUP07061.1 peptide deformylase [Bacillus coahuilensis p1.1.43]